MATGQIKRLARDRGFGFIRPDGASEVVRITSAEVEWFYSDNTDPNVEAAGKYKWTDDDAGGGD